MSVDFVSDFVAGWAAGAAGLVVGHPFDTLKVRLQALKYTNVLQCAIQTMKQEAAAGFYKGMLFPFLATGFLHSIYFAGYRVMINVLNPASIGVNHYVPSHSHVLIGSVVGGFLQWIPSCPIEVLQQQGLRQGLYKGGSVMLVRDLLAYACYLPVYEYLYRHLNPNRTKTSLTSTAIAGGIAGCTSWLSILPFDLVKSRLQADDIRNPKYKGVLHCALVSFRNEGFGVFYTGFGVVAARAIPVNAILFITYDQILRFIYKINGGNYMVE